MIEMRKWSDGSDVDAAALAKELELLLLAVYEVSPWTAIQMAEVLRSDVNNCAIAADETQLVGFLIWQETDFEAEVLQIAVLPSYQGQKIATALFPTDTSQDRFIITQSVSEVLAVTLFP